MPLHFCPQGKPNGLSVRGTTRLSSATVQAVLQEPKGVPKTNFAPSMQAGLPHYTANAAPAVSDRSGVGCPSPSPATAIGASGYPFAESTGDIIHIQPYTRPYGRTQTGFFHIRTLDAFRFSLGNSINERRNVFG